MNAEGRQVTPQRTIRRIGSAHGEHGKRRSGHGAEGPARELRPIDRRRILDVLRIQRAEVLVHAERDVSGIQATPVEVEYGCAFDERRRNRGGLGGSKVRRDPREDPAAAHDEPDVITAPQMCFRNGVSLVDGVVERRRSVEPGPQLHGRIQHQPDDVALLLLVIPHHELSAARGCFPRDSLQRITRAVLSNLTELVSVAGKGTRTAGLRSRPAATPAGGPERHAVARRDDFDAERVRERERDLEEAGAAPDFE